MKKGCLTWLALYVVLGLGFSSWFFLRFPVPPPGAESLLPPMPFRIKAALGAGFVIAIPAVIAISLGASAGARLKERSLLLRTAGAGRPRDGERSTFFGPIMRDGPPLTAPLSRCECLLYRYEVTHLESDKAIRRDSPGGTMSRVVTDAEGFALTPSSIRTAAGPVKLCAFVRLKFKPQRFPAGGDVRRNLDAWLAQTSFRSSGSLESDDRAMEAISREDSGAIRYDRGIGRIEPGVAPIVKEHVVRQGEEVCVTGRYSAARAAIVPDAEPVLKPAQMWKGPLEVVSRRMTLGAFGYTAMAAVWGLLAAAGAWAFYRFGPSFW